MKTRKLITIIIATLPLVLASCSGGSTASANTSTGRNSGPNDDTDVWADIHRDDSGQEDHHLAFSYDNNSSYDVNFMGCQSMDGATVTESAIIAGGTSASRTKSYTGSMSYLDSGAGAIDPAHILDNSIRFTENNEWSNDTRNCYYSIYVPEAHDTLYFKLVMHKYDACSDEQLGCKLDAPQQQAKNNSNIIGMTPSALIATNSLLATELIGTWSPYNVMSQKSVVTSIIPDVNTEAIIDAGLDDQYASFVNMFNAGLETELASASAPNLIFSDLGQRKTLFEHKLVSGPPSPFIDEQLVDGTLPMKLQKLEQNGFSMKIKLTSDNKLVGVLKSKNDWFTGKSYQFDLTDQGWSSLKIDLDSDHIEIFDPITGDDKFPDLPIALKDPDFKLPTANDVLNIIPQGTNKTVASVDSLLNDGGSMLGADLSDNATVLAYQSVAKGERLVLKDAENTLSKTMKKTFAASDAIDPVIETILVVGGYFVLGPIMATMPDGVGDYHTTINHLHLDAVTADDVADWNATHSGMSAIAANTKVTTLLKNSLNNQVRLTFADSSIDPQLNFTISLDEMSTPWTRVLENNDTSKDWYLGDVSKSTGNKASAAMHIAIDSSLDKSDPISEVMNAYKAAYQENFAGGLNSIYTTLDAPSITLNSIQNQKTGKYIYNRNSKRNGLLKVGANGVIKLQDGKIAGAYLNNGNTSNLSVTLPDTNPTVKFGLGLTAKYIDDGESGFSFLSEHNGNTLAQFESYFGSESTLLVPRLFTIFHCNDLPAVGTPCALDLTVKGMNDNVKRSGKIYIKDVGSNSAMFPVYLNYKLIAEPTSLDFIVGGGSNSTVYLENTSADDYSKITLSGLDSPNAAGAVITSSSCNTTVPSGGQCQITLDLSKCFDPAGGYGGEFSLNAVAYGMDGKPTGATSDDVVVTAQDQS